MKKLLICYTNYGQAFVYNGELIGYVHSNDANYRPEYFNVILNSLNIEVKEVRLITLPLEIRCEIEELENE